MRRLFTWGICFLKENWAEILRYFVTGVCTTAINAFLFWLLGTKLEINVHVSNVTAWICSTLFAFFTNCLFVFRVRPENSGMFLKFMALFFGERLFTLGVEELILLVFITMLSFPKMPVKFAAILIVIALNYLISKFMIFKKKRADTGAEANGG